MGVVFIALAVVLFLVHGLGGSVRDWDLLAFGLAFLAAGHLVAGTGRS
jgi:hypothetical protein